MPPKLPLSFHRLCCDEGQGVQKWPRTAPGLLDVNLIKFIKWIWHFFLRPFCRLEPVGRFVMLVASRGFIDFEARASKFPKGKLPILGEKLQTFQFGCWQKYLRAIRLGIAKTTQTKAPIFCSEKLQTFPCCCRQKYLRDIHQRVGAERTVFSAKLSSLKELKATISH